MDFKKGWGWVGGMNPCKPEGMDCLSQEREVYIQFRTGAIRSIIVVILHRGKKGNTWKALPRMFDPCGCEQ